MCERHFSQRERLYQHVQSLLPYRSLFDYYHDAVCAMDDLGNFVMANAQVQSLTGYTSDELFTMELVQLTLPDDVKTVREGFVACLGGLTSEFEVGLFNKYGDCLDVHIALHPLDIEGQISGVYGILKDIRARKRLERSLMKSRLMLEQTRQTARIGMWELDPITRSAHWTIEIFEMFGLQICDPVPFEYMVQYIHPDDRQELINRLYPLISDHQPRDIEYRICRTDGKVRILHSKINEGIDGELVGTIQDVTEFKETELLVRQAEKLSAVGQLAAGVAHEIRNPLTALRGFLQLLERCVHDSVVNDQSDRELRYLGIMKSELARIELIVNELLVFAKPQAIQFTEACVSVLLSDVVTLLNPQAIVKNVTIELLGQQTADTIECDPNQLKQLFVNIVKNAIEAMPIGGVVTMGVTCDRETVTVFVEDEGEGVAPEALPRLMEPFFSTKENGTGLGLMVCHRIVEAHFGHMCIESQLGVGTRIDITLPVRHHRALSSAR